MDVIGFSEAATANSRIEIINANPDSSSGIVTVPKTIASGETVTIPAGRTAILPGLVVEGDLLVEGTVFIPTGSTYTQQTIKTEAISNVAGSTVVDVTDIVSRVGNQTIDGTKTFSSSPVAPTPTAGDSSTKVATTAFATSQDIGVNQTWQDVTASRVLRTTYTNSTGKPIIVSISNFWYNNNGVYDFITVDGVIVVKTGTTENASTTSITQMVAIVPNGSTYSVTAQRPFKHWGELR